MVGERNNVWRGEDHVEALWANGGYTSPDGAKALCGLCGVRGGLTLCTCWLNYLAGVSWYTRCGDEGVD